jgi:hypothetical protein
MPTKVKNHDLYFLMCKKFSGLKPDLLHYKLIVNKVVLEEVFSY